MKRREIKELMLKGTFYSKNWHTYCKVLHIFKHKTWIMYKGKIRSIPHKYITFGKLIEGESTYNPTPRLTVGKSESILKQLTQKYKK